MLIICAIRNMTQALEISPVSDYYVRYFQRPHGKATDTVMCYMPHSDSWSPQPNAPTTMNSCQAATLQRKIFLLATEYKNLVRLTWCDTLLNDINRLLDLAEMILISHIMLSICQLTWYGGYTLAENRSLKLGISSASVSMDSLFQSKYFCKFIGYS